MPRHSLIKNIQQIAPLADIKKNSHYMFVRDGEFVNQVNDICYARLCGYVSKKITSLRIYINQHKRPEVNKDSWNAWMKWVTQESYWRHAFKSLRNWEKNGISIDCSYTLPYAMGAASAIREGYEFPAATDAWLWMVEKGIHPALAHLASCYLNRKEGDKYISNGYGGKGHHAAIRDNMSMKGMKAYISGEYTKVHGRSPMNKNHGSFTGIFNLFPECLEGRSLRDVMDKHQKKEGKGWNVVTFYTLDDKFIASLLAFQKEIENA